MLISKIDILTYSIIGLQIAAFFWLIKAMSGSVWLYIRERHTLDLVIAIMFLGLSLDRAMAIAASYSIYSVIPVDVAIPESAYTSLSYRLITIVILNFIFLIYDLTFYFHGNAR